MALIIGGVVMNYECEPEMVKVWRQCTCTQHSTEPQPYCWDCEGSGGWYELVDANEW